MGDGNLIVCRWTGDAMMWGCQEGHQTTLLNLFKQPYKIPSGSIPGWPNSHHSQFTYLFELGLPLNLNTSRRNDLLAQEAQYRLIFISCCGHLHICSKSRTRKAEQLRRGLRMKRKAIFLTLHLGPAQPSAREVTEQVDGEGGCGSHS